jgi:hypothetical protein
MDLCTRAVSTGKVLRYTDSKELGVKKRFPRKSTFETGNVLFEVFRTGDHCPASGWWVSEVDPDSPRFVAEGSVMPARHGLAVTWAPATVIRQ